MKDIVLIPTYIRAEYLNVCLEHLCQTIRTPSEKEFWVCQDFRQNDDHRYRIQMDWTKEVIERFRSHSTSKRFARYPMSTRGTVSMSWNLIRRLSRLTRAMFTWWKTTSWSSRTSSSGTKPSEELEPEAMCSIAYRCSSNHEARTDVTDPGAYFTTARDYASIGVLLEKREPG